MLIFQWLVIITLWVCGILFLPTPFLFLSLVIPWFLWGVMSDHGQIHDPE